MFPVLVMALSVFLPTGESPISVETTEAVTYETPAAGLGLSPRPIVATPLRLPTRSPPLSTPLPRPLSRPGAAAAAALGVLSGAAALTIARRKRDDEPIYVLVHGNGGSPSDFGTLMRRMGVASDRVVAFDYSDGSPLVTSTEASRSRPTSSAAVSLGELIRSLSVNYSNIYSIHHSRGGAVGVSLIADLDDGTTSPIDGYVGAALLDPAIDTGVGGMMQRLGGFTTLVPDNGGFSPIRCAEGVCRDVRENLGERSGVDVIAVRNRDAIVTNFSDEPKGLRVLNLVKDGGVSAAWWLPLSPILFVWRASQAHGSVLTHPSVASCISAEVAMAGSCIWRDGATD